jgi:peptide/nickel transport system substrate-binding protein
MDEIYWDRYWKKRRTRRGFLGGAAAAGMGATGLALAGCGDDNGGKSTPAGGAATNTAASGRSATAGPSVSGDPYANAKKGGTLKIFSGGDPPTLDPYGNLSYLTKGFAAFVYSRLMKFSTKWGEPPEKSVPSPDLAASWEMTNPDGTEFTFTLKDGLTFHNLPPVNGRAITADDIQYSWTRMTAKTTPNANQVAFVDKLETPDDKTVKFTLKQPNADFLALIADMNYFVIMPGEADGKFDPAKTPIGSGPWVMDNYTPSSNFSFHKFDKWSDPGFPLADKVSLAIIPDYSSQKAQYLAGNVDVFGSIGAGPVPQDVPEVKSAAPKATLVGSIANGLDFFYFDAAPDSPWTKDHRVRVAISMAMDRDGLDDLVYEVKKLRDKGFDVETKWMNAVPPGYTKYWLDPQSKEAGPSGANFKYTPDDAKKLLSAAGYPNGLEAKFQYTNIYGPQVTTVAEACAQFMAAIGVKTTTEVQNYQSKYITQTFVGNFTGIAFGPQSGFLEPGAYLTRWFSDNPQNSSRVTDPKILQMTQQQQQELDADKRQQIIYDIQRYNAEHMFYIPCPGVGTAWTGAREWIHGFKEVRAPSGSYGVAAEVYPYLWTDKA